MEEGLEEPPRRKTKRQNKRRHTENVLSTNVPESSGTPLKRRLRKYGISSETQNNITKEEGLKYEKSPLKDSHFSQNCVVNVETLTPSKLDLIKTVNSPLIQIRNEIANRKNKHKASKKTGRTNLRSKSIDNATKSRQNIVDRNDNRDHENYCDDIKQPIKRTKEEKENIQEQFENVHIEENELNTTFTLSEEEHMARNECTDIETLKTVKNYDFSNPTAEIWNQTEKYNKNKSCILNQKIDSPRTPRKKWSMNRNRSMFDFRPFNIETDNQVSTRNDQRIFTLSEEENVTRKDSNDIETLKNLNTVRSYDFFNPSADVGNKAEKYTNNILNQITDSPGTLRKKWSKNKNRSIFDFRSFNVETDNQILNNFQRIDINMKEDELSSVPNRRETFTKEDIQIIQNAEDPINNSLVACNNITNISTDTTKTYENITLRRRHSKLRPNTEINTPSPFLVSPTNGSILNINTLDLNNQTDMKKQSITKRLSKQNKFDKSKRLSDSSRISKTLRLSTVDSSRTPRLSGSKSVQLYNILTNEKPSSSVNDYSCRANNTNLFESPPSSSTPKVVKKHVTNPLLKNTLKKRKYNVTFNDTVNVSKDESSASKSTAKSNPASRVKMPNFALLHQKQFDKMESIVDYKQRKDERAKILLSGTKPIANNLSTSSSSKCNKKLANMFNNLQNSNTWGEGQRNEFSILPITPSRSSKKLISIPFSSKSEEQKVIKSMVSVESKILNKAPYKSKQFETKVIPCKTVDRAELSIKRTPYIEQNKILTSKRALDNKFNSKIPLKLLERKENNAVNKTKAVNEVNGYTRFGFRVPIKPKRQDIVNSVINKAKIPKKNNREEKRAVIKGVRSNRRFDLLMQMREKK